MERQNSTTPLVRLFEDLCETKCFENCGIDLYGARIRRVRFSKVISISVEVEFFSRLAGQNMCFKRSQTSISFRLMVVINKIYFVDCFSCSLIT